MTTAPTPSPARSPLASVGRILVLPLCLGALALAVSGSLGHVLIGLLLAAGLLLGAANGVYAQMASAQLLPSEGLTRSAIVHSSMKRLGAVTLVALVLAWLARPNGWLLLVGLAFYQLISLGSAFGAAMREVRGG